MSKRISITPKQGLLSVHPPLRGKFAQTACEILINEGRMTEVLLKISGLTLEDLTDQLKPPAGLPRRRKQTNKSRSTSSFSEHKTLCEDMEEMVTDGFLRGNMAELRVVKTNDSGTDSEDDSDQSTLF
ncbi:MAG: hypothetical protein AB7U43_00025 [Desulfobacter sp.]